jgi:hypothetical protein
MSIWFLIVAEWVMLMAGIAIWEYALRRRLGE